MKLQSIRASQVIFTNPVMMAQLAKAKTPMLPSQFTLPRTQAQTVSTRLHIHVKIVPVKIRIMRIGLLDPAYRS